MVSRKLCCICLSAANSRAGSSAPCTAICGVRSPVATISATCSDWAKGRTILRVRVSARITVITNAPSKSAITQTRALLYTAAARSVALLAWRLLSAISSLSVAVSWSASWFISPLTTAVAASIWPCSDNWVT
ncbi:hypothetical protein D3C84_718660 [compost metagenome]